MLEILFSTHSSLPRFEIFFSGPDINFRVWSSSSDRSIVRCGYEINHKEKPFALPLLSGFVFALDIAPTTLDTYVHARKVSVFRRHVRKTNFSSFSLAIGTGDGKVTLWNTSTDDFIDITTLSNKIVNSKIMSVSMYVIERDSANISIPHGGKNGKMFPFIRITVPSEHV